MVSMTRMTAILDVDLPNRCAVVQPGLINLWLTNAVRDRGWFLLRSVEPDGVVDRRQRGHQRRRPSLSQVRITTITSWVSEIVTGAGERLRLGGKTADRPGYDLTGLAVGAEGTFGLITAITVRLLHAREAVKTLLARSPRSRTPRRRSRRSSPPGSPPRRSR